MVVLNGMVTFGGDVGGTVLNGMVAFGGDVGGSVEWDGNIWW